MEHMLSRTHKNRRGVSTVLGILIFIGVLYTCIIPLYLYVNEVNGMYDQTVHEMSNFDLERTQETCDAFAYPLNDTSDYLNIYIKNKCALDVKIERVWINNVYYDFENATAQAMNNYTIKNLYVNQQKNVGTLLVKAISTRGKSYPSKTNPLIWNGTSWAEGATRNIQVVIESTKQSNQKYNVTVTGPNGFKEVRQAIKASLEDNVVVSFHVINEGRYYISVINIGSKSLLYPTPPYVDINYKTNPKEWIYCFDI